MIDHIVYNSSALSPLIAERNKFQRFLIRRDPRDLSHIYVLEQHSNRYLEIPYRTLSRPTITLWEHKRAVNYLNDRGFHRMNETLIFQAIERMRELVKTASSKNKAARRQQAKTDAHLMASRQKKLLSKKSKSALTTSIEDIDADKSAVIKPFDIEIW
jgi:putative transposase